MNCLVWHVLGVDGIGILLLLSLGLRGKFVCWSLLIQLTPRVCWEWVHESDQVGEMTLVVCCADVVVVRVLVDVFLEVFLKWIDIRDIPLSIEANEYLRKAKISVSVDQ